MPGDEQIGDIVEIAADNVRLRAYFQHIVANTFDQRGLPTGRDGAESVPGVAGDHTELGRCNPEPLLDIGVGLPRRLVMLRAVRAEAPFEQIDDAAVFELSGLHFKQIVGEAE